MFKPVITTAFISYSSKDIDKAKIVKTVLEKDQIETIIFPEDVKLGRWRDKIPRVIENSDFFIVLLTENYHASDYADHEFGIAMKSNTEIIILIESNTRQYGFLEQYQTTVRCKMIDKNNIGELIEIILERSGLETKRFDFLIKGISTSISHIESKFYVSEIEKYRKFTDKQLERLVCTYLDNRQMENGWDIINIIVGILIKNIDNITPTLKKQLMDLNQDKHKDIANKFTRITSGKKMGRSSFLYNQGLECARLGKHEDAIRYYKMSTDIDDYNSNVYVAMSESYEALDKSDLAKDYFGLAEFVERDLLSSYF